MVVPVERGELRSPEFRSMVSLMGKKKTISRASVVSSMGKRVSSASLQNFRRRQHQLYVWAEVAWAMGRLANWAHWLEPGSLEARLLFLLGSGCESSYGLAFFSHNCFIFGVQ